LNINGKFAEVMKLGKGNTAEVYDIEECGFASGSGRGWLHQFKQVHI